MKAITFKFLLLTTILVLSSNVVFGQFDWTKDARNPIFSGSGNGTWDKHVFLPMVLFNADSNRYEMWYCGSYGYSSGWYPYSVGLAYSPDGVTWTKYAGNPVLSPTVGSWDASMISPCWVARESGQYKMWYYGSVNNVKKLGYATSPNGIIWTKNPNPILSAGTAAWEAGGVLWPSILNNSGGYTMFYTGVDAAGTVYRLGRATSLDGINWQRDTINNPVISVGAPGQWDDLGVTAGLNCLKIDNIIYMWYTAWSISISRGRVGLATSTNDGVTWAKYSGNPVLNFGVAGSWDEDYVESGTVMLEGNTLRMWYDGSRDNTLTNLWRIGIATSTLVVPVELTSFSAEALDRKVILKWATATELNNNGFEIQRKVAESDFATIGFVRGEGTTTNQKEYSYIDKDLANGKYYYRLKQFDYNGTYEYSNVIEVDVRSLDNYALEQNYPNPFNPTTTIGYILKEKINAKLILLNAIGEEVAVLVNEEQDKGFHKVDFNASTLASGVYFYQLKAGEFMSVKKMLLLK
jgi:predicted GH43/DUF377 family glycosyl hydrolase